MVAVVTAVLAGSFAGVLTAVASDGSAAAALPVGIAVGAIALVALVRFQRITVERQLGTGLLAEDPAQE